MNAATSALADQPRTTGDTTALTETLSTICRAAFGVSWMLGTEHAVRDLCDGNRTVWGAVTVNDVAIPLQRVRRIADDGRWVARPTAEPVAIATVEFDADRQPLSGQPALVMYADLLALVAHTGQTDKAGRPYIGHPRRVAARLDDPRDKVVGLLHDVLEDTATSADALADSGIPDDLIGTLTLLDHSDGSPYPEYIERLMDDRRAIRVKLADIADNLDPDRCARLDAATRRRLERKYLSARTQLQAALH